MIWLQQIFVIGVVGGVELGLLDSVRSALWHNMSTRHLVTDRFDWNFCEFDGKRCAASYDGIPLVDVLFNGKWYGKAAEGEVVSYWIPMTEEEGAGKMCDFFRRVAPKLENDFVFLTLPYPVGEHGSPWEGHSLRNVAASRECQKAMEELEAASPVDLISKFASRPKLRAWFVADHGPHDDSSKADLEEAGWWFAHRKIRQIPLGVRRHVESNGFLEAWRAQNVSRDNLLLMNFRRHAHRDVAEANVVKNFNGTIKNEYYQQAHGKAKDCKTIQGRCDAQKAYYASVLASRFVMSPFGSKADCHRHWEILLLGAIPVMIASPPLLELFHGLPAVFVGSWAEVTPQRLSYELARYDQRIHFDWDKLTVQYWRRQVYAAKTHF